MTLIDPAPRLQPESPHPNGQATLTDLLNLLELRPDPAADWDEDSRQAHIRALRWWLDRESLERGERS